MRACPDNWALKGPGQGKTCLGTTILRAYACPFYSRGIVMCALNGPYIHIEGEGERREKKRGREAIRNPLVIDMQGYRLREREIKDETP